MWDDIQFYKDHQNELPDHYLRMHMRFQDRCYTILHNHMCCRDLYQYVCIWMPLFSNPGMIYPYHPKKKPYYVFVFYVSVSFCYNLSFSTTIV